MTKPIRVRVSVNHIGENLFGTLDSRGSYIDECGKTYHWILFDEPVVSTIFGRMGYLVAVNEGCVTFVGHH